MSSFTTSDCALGSKNARLQSGDRDGHHWKYAIDTRGGPYTRVFIDWRLNEVGECEIKVFGLRRVEVRGESPERFVHTRVLLARFRREVGGQILVDKDHVRCRQLLTRDKVLQGRMSAWR